VVGRDDDRLTASSVRPLVWIETYEICLQNVLWRSHRRLEGPVSAVDGFFARSLLGIAVAWIGVAATTSGIRSVRDWWGILRADSMAIDEAIATDGLAQIRGRVRPTGPNGTLVSPLRDEECVAYEYSISKIVQDAGDSSIDSDVAYDPFVVSDGTAEILVEPDEASLALDTTTRRPTSEREIAERTGDERLDLESSASTSGGGELTAPIELSEGTIRVGESVTVVGRASPVPEDASTDADAVVTSEDGHLTVTDDDPGDTALRKAARGGFLSILGLLFGGFGALVLVTAVSDVV
jgi:hypothetical protein